MTANEFAQWLRGFLDGKDKLTAKERDKIVEEARKIAAEPYFRPYYPTWWYQSGTTVPFVANTTGDTYTITAGTTTSVS